MNPPLTLNRHATFAAFRRHAAIATFILEKWRTFGPTVIFERNPFEARLHHPSKNQNQRFFPPNIASPSSSFQKKHSAKIAIKVLHGYFPFKRSRFPAKQKTAQAQNLGFPEAPAKNSEIYVDPRRRHIVYYKALKRRDDRVADCA